MPSFFKKLLCKHDWDFKFIPLNKYLPYMGGTLQEDECTKCGKFKKITM